MKLKVQGSRFKESRLASVLAVGFWLLLGPCALDLVPVFAAPLPSLFRGVVVAESQHGVRVVSVEESSQAFLAELRPEDLIVQINETPVNTIEEFSAISSSLKGRARHATMLVFRHGEPRRVLLHLYSYPVLRDWDLSFVPDHDLRFVEPRAGRAYWTNLGRGYETANELTAALNAYLNALHHVPSDLEIAMKVSDVLWRIAQQDLTRHRLREALAPLQAETLLLRRLFDHPLSPTQLDTIKSRLEQTLRLLQQSRPSLQTKPVTSAR